MGVNVDCIINDYLIMNEYLKQRITEITWKMGKLMLNARKAFAWEIGIQNLLL